MGWEIDGIVDLRLRVHGIRVRFDPTFRGTRISGGIFATLGCRSNRVSAAMSALAAERVSSLSWDRWSLPVLTNQGTPLLCLSVSSADSRCRSRWPGRHPQPGDEHQDILEHPGVEGA